MPPGQIGADGLEFVIVPPGRKLPDSSRGPQAVPGVYVLKKVRYIAQTVSSVTSEPEGMKGGDEGGIRMWTGA